MLTLSVKQKIKVGTRPDWSKPWVSTKKKDKKMLLWQIIRTNFDL